MIRSGINRSQRLLPALGEKYILPDEKDFKDWLVYARNLAAHLQYYNADNVKEGDWQPFMDSDVAAQLALISVQDVVSYKDRIRMLFDAIQSPDLKNDPVRLRRAFGLLFSAIISLAQRMDYFGNILPDYVPLKLSINNLIATRLTFSLKRLLGYYKAAKNSYQAIAITDPIIEEIVVDDWADVVVLQGDENMPKGWEILAFPQSKAEDILNASKQSTYTLRTGLSAKWITNPAAIDFFTQYNLFTQPDVTIYNYPVGVIPATDFWPVLNHAVNHNLFSAIFADFLSAYAKIISDAQQQLIKTVTDQNDHEPHFALYLTFLHLFKKSQSVLNTFTRKHLDFYYEDVLRLLPKKSEANHAYLILELANLVKEHLIKKGTAFKAGKDSLNKDVFYKSDKDCVLNRAIVSELRSFYRATALDKIGGTAAQEGLLFASPVAKSADGLGAKITTESQDWHPFANKTFADGELSAINMPPANIGFSIASHYLFLKEGSRKVTLTFKGTGLSALNGKQFVCSFTTEKKWLDKDVVFSTSSNTTCTIILTLLAADPPITVFDPKVHLDNFQNIDTPIVKFVLKNIAGNNQYDQLKNVVLSSVDVKVNVGELDKYDTSGMKELLVVSDFGSVDPSKPFLPYGSNPKAGGGLVIGSKELFSKKNAKFTLSVSWAELIERIQDMDYNLIINFFPSAQLKFLENGVWKNGDFSTILNKENKVRDFGELELFWGANSIMIADTYLPTNPVHVPDQGVVDYTQDYLPYGITSQDGFFKLQLNADFQFDEYLYELQKHLINLANKVTPNPKPKVPYVPKVQSMYLSYEATTTINFASLQPKTGKFIHLYPFGTDEIDSSNVTLSKARLMPQFTHGSSVMVHNIAEFYIGLQNVVPAQRVSILFKVLDGSTNPLQGKPEEHVFWSYLSKNVWKDFDKDDVGDATQQLIETGIIDFAIPDEATATNSLLPSGFHWLKASIKELPEQVCRLIDVRAQAIQVTFADQGNAEDFLLKPLAAGIISKLLEPDPLVRKIEQPYASYGGRYKEDGTNYHIRVSERLRHKDRAITIRDFEQIVLEAFPDIHKAKCLNHTRFEPKEVEADTIYNEQAPGHVTIIAIPDLRNKNAINPLRPYTSRSRLEAIREVLTKRTNCNMKLHVENPAFEEIRIETDIVLTAAASGNDTFYVEQLKMDIVKFLTPWAYDFNTDINFGGHITKSDLINFIEERSYVDFILKLDMFFRKSQGSTEVQEAEEITASTARSILVSAPAKKHVVVIKPKPQPPADAGCE